MDRDGQQNLLPEVLWDDGLNARQRQFVINFCTDKTCFLNATAAYIKTFTRPGKALADSSIQSNASRMMRNDKIKTAINTLLRVSQDDKDKINEFRLLHYIETLAYFDAGEVLGKFYDSAGDMKKFFESLGELSICIEGVKEGRFKKELKLKDRYKALEMLANYLGVVRTPESNVGIKPVVILTKKDIEALREQEAPAATAAEDAEYEVMNAGVSDE